MYTFKKITALKKLSSKAEKNLLTDEEGVRLPCHKKIKTREQLLERMRGIDKWKKFIPEKVGISN